jgi:hypothetical protein
MRITQSQDVVLVVHSEAFRVVNAGNLELVSTPILPSWVQQCKVLDLHDEVFNDENSLQMLKDKKSVGGIRPRTSSQSRSKKGRTSSKEVAEKLSAMAHISDEQRDILLSQVRTAVVSYEMPLCWHITMVELNPLPPS